MVLIPPVPTQAEVDQLRSAALQKFEGGNFHAKDIERIRTEDKLIRRYLMHHDNDQKLALDMIMDTFKWRVELNVNDITKESIPQEFFDVGTLFSHNRDKDNCKMLIFSVRLHQKGVGDMDMVKKFLIYNLERLEREEDGEQITVYFDMTNTGMKNMDMELIQYMIKLFNSHYPWFLNYIIVFEMPWLLSAMWKIIKNWLPPKAIDKIKFLDKKSLKDYVTPDQSLVIWGGTDSYVYKFEPEAVAAAPVANGDIDAARKVRFAEGSLPQAPTSSKPQLKRGAPGNGNLYLEIDPSEELLFNNCRTGATADIVLTNPTDSAVAFKIKTTSPEKYRVKPSVGILEPGHQIDIGVTVSEQLAPSLLVRDKFLVMGSSVTSLDLSSQEISQLFKTLNKDDLFETRLRVGVAAAAADTPESTTFASSPLSALPTEVISKLDQLLHRQSAIEEQIRSAKKVVYLTLMVIIIILVVVILATNNMTSTLLNYSASMHNILRGVADTEEHREL